jgi:small-conductance mechanosensitive channel
MKNLEILKRELEELTPELFNTVYRNLIDIAQTSDREYEVLDALSFISSCNLMLEKVNETLKNLQDETHWQRCADKEKIIAFQEEKNSLLKEDLNKYKEKCSELTDENIQLYKELEATKGERNFELKPDGIEKHFNEK